MKPRILRSFNMAGGEHFTRRCCGCNQEFEVVVEVGEKPDHYSATTELCEPCLLLALETLRAAKEGS